VGEILDEVFWFLVGCVVGWENKRKAFSDVDNKVADDPLGFGLFVGKILFEEEVPGSLEAFNSEAQENSGDDCEAIVSVVGSD